MNYTNMVSQHSVSYAMDRQNAKRGPAVKGRITNNIDCFVGQPLIKRAEENYPSKTEQPFLYGARPYHLLR